jgi:glycosyltransferase involved in cell wall biosynthesis
MGQGVLPTVYRLREHGIRTVFGVCDIIDPEMAEACDATIVVSEKMRSLYPAHLQSRVHVVHDGIEEPQYAKSLDAIVPRNGSKSLKAVLVTGQLLRHIPEIGRRPAFVDITVVGAYPHGANWRDRIRPDYWDWRRTPSLGLGTKLLKFHLLRDFATRSWSQETTYAALLGADIGIIPVDRSGPPDPATGHAMWQLKSENRLTMKMAIGLPVIATPIPAYHAVMRHGENGFFANNAIEWRRAFEALRDPKLRVQIGRCARESVIERFSKQEQVRKLLELLDGLKNDEDRARQIHLKAPSNLQA